MLLGADTRESSPWIAGVLAAALEQEGTAVENAGIITTPGVAYLTHKHGFHAGVVISASHNPWQDNGIKVFGSDGYKLPDETEIRIEEEIFRRIESAAEPQSARRRCVTRYRGKTTIDFLRSPRPRLAAGWFEAGGRLRQRCGVGRGAEIFSRAGRQVELENTARWPQHQRRLRSASSPVVAAATGPQAGGHGPHL